MDRYFEIGKIAGTHGLKGTLRIFPTTEDPSRFTLLKEITLEFQGRETIYKVQKVGFHKNMVLLDLVGIDDINQAELLKGGRIIIPEKDALPLEEDEYYTRDLYGMEVYTEDNEFLGILDDVYRTGANDVYSVVKEGKKPLLLPAIKQCILKVNTQENKMTVRLLKGLVEE